MTYKFDDVDDEDMDELGFPGHIEQDYIESNNNKTDDYSMDALDVYDSYYG